MKALVVVDMQNDFITGSLGTKEAEAIVDKVCEKIRTFDGLIAATYDTHGENYLETQEGKILPVVHCVENTYGWQLNEKVEDAIVDRYKKDDRVREYFKPTFGSVELAEKIGMIFNHETQQMEEPEEIILIGLCTDICVISNALILKAFYPETKITVDASCCAGVTQESHKNALAAMRMCQINIEND